MSSEPPPHYDIIPAFQSWLSTTHAKIQDFWIGADWRLWARFDLFSTLDKSLPDCLVTHSNSDFWRHDDSEIDILIEPRDSAAHRPVAVVLCCEKVNENEGSYEAFVARWEEVWAGLQAKGTVEGDFEGVRVVLVGFGGEPVGEGLGEFGTKPVPEVFRCGEVRCFNKGFEPEVE